MKFIHTFFLFRLITDDNINTEKTEPGACVTWQKRVNNKGTDILNNECEALPLGALALTSLVEGGDLEVVVGSKAQYLYKKSIWYGVVDAIHGNCHYILY